MLNFAAQVSRRALVPRRLGVFCMGLMCWLLAPVASADLARPRAVSQPQPEIRFIPSPTARPKASSDAAAPSAAPSVSADPPASAAPPPSADPPASAEPIPAEMPSALLPQDPPDTAQAANARSAQAARTSFLVAASFVALLAGFWGMMRWRKSRLRAQLEAMEKRDAGAGSEDD